MEVANKKVDHVVISLTPEEAEKLQAILNASQGGTREIYPCDHEVLEEFSCELWDELNQLDVRHCFA